MFVSHKSNVIQSIHETEWQCRRLVKGLDKSDYWAWLETVTTDHVPDYSGETDYSIVETEVEVEGCNKSGHITSNVDGKYYHLKWNGSKIVNDDDALAAYQLAEKWKQVRQDRDRLLNETDWVVTKATETGVTVTSAWKTYRQKLRDVPSQSDPDNITWPTKPS